MKSETCRHEGEGGQDWLRGRGGLVGGNGTETYVQEIEPLEEKERDEV